MQPKPPFVDAWAVNDSSIDRTPVTDAGYRQFLATNKTDALVVDVLNDYDLLAVSIPGGILVGIDEGMNLSGKRPRRLILDDDAGMKEDFRREKYGQGFP